MAEHGNKDKDGIERSVWSVLVTIQDNKNSYSFDSEGCSNSDSSSMEWKIKNIISALCLLESNDSSKEGVGSGRPIER